MIKILECLISRLHLPDGTKKDLKRLIEEDEQESYDTGYDEGYDEAKDEITRNI